jgi:hypothetical protein
MNEEQIKRMVDRFLQWPLPTDFAPDGGIFFDGKSHPIGTNLLTATQAKEMFRHVLEVTKEREVCEWQQRITSDGVRWESACGWTMYAENPSDTVKATMCPCGKPIKVKEVQP